MFCFPERKEITDRSKIKYYYCSNTLFLNRFVVNDGFSFSVSCPRTSDVPHQSTIQQNPNTSLPPQDYIFASDSCHAVCIRHEKKLQMKQHTTELVRSLLLPSWLDLRHFVTSPTNGHPIHHVDIIDGNDYGRCETVSRLRSATRHCDLEYLVLSQIEIDEDVTEALVDLLKASKRHWEGLYMEFCGGKLDQAMSSILALDIVRKLEVAGAINLSCMNAISEGLRVNNGLMELSLFTTLDFDTTRVLIQGLEASEGLQSLKLIKSTIQKDAINELARFFRCNGKLKSLSLDSCICYHEGMVTLLDSVSKNPTLEELSVSNVLLESSSLPGICNFIARNTLKRLSLRDQRSNGTIGLERFLLSGALSDNNSLQILDLSKSKLDDRALKLLIPRIQYNLTLKELHLEETCVTDDGAVFLGKKMHLLNGVQRIFLHKNEFSTVGLTAILEGTRRSHLVHEVTVTVDSSRRSVYRLQVLINYETCLNAAGKHLLQNREISVGLWPKVFERAGSILFSPYAKSQMRSARSWRKVQQMDVIFHMLRHLDISSYTNKTQT